MKNEIMKFTIIIEETVSQDFEVEAKNAEDAMKIAAEKYKNCEFVLEPGNLICKQMGVVSPDNEMTEWIRF